MIGRARAVVLTGLTGHVIDIEAHLAAALPAFTIVGLPDASLQESRDRVRAAVTNSGLVWPNRRITVNLTPASLPKSGSVTDLGIAVAVLSAAGLVDPRAVGDTVFLGELGLDGRVRPVRGVLPAVAAALAQGMTRFAVATGNADEASLVPGAHVLPVATLADLARHLGNEEAVPSASHAVVQTQAQNTATAVVPDLAEVRGQEDARFALEVAAAGGHHLLMVGPPGAGKTMLASRLPGILPDLTQADALLATSVHSLAGTLDPSKGLMARPPFEAPHHSASAAAIVGGGTNLARPGAISRAHGGVLFLDEAPEFPVHVLQTLRQPLESGHVVLHRSHGAVSYPARFQLVLAANPCPCGGFYGPQAECTCTALVRRRYFGRLSGPLLDRVDLQVEVRPVGRGGQAQGETTEAVRARVARARERARRRVGAFGWDSNAQLSGGWLREHTPAAARGQVQRAVERGRLTARGMDRVLRVAWTLADLAGQEVPSADHVGQAMTLRMRGTA